MPHIIFVTQFTCSECKVPIKLYPSEAVPDECPNCHVKFEQHLSYEILKNGSEHTGGIEIEKK